MSSPSGPVPGESQPPGAHDAARLPAHDAVEASGPARQVRASGPPPAPPPAQQGGHGKRRSHLWHTLLDRARLRLRARRRRRKRIRLYVVLGLLAALVAVYAYMTSDAQVERLTEEYLAGLFQARVHIHSASFRFFGGIEVEKISVAPEDPAQPIFTAEQVRLVHDPLALLIGRLKVREIIAIRPGINLEQRDGVWNFQQLFPDKDQRRAEEMLAQQPVIYVEEGALRVRQLKGHEQVYEHELRLSGVVQPDGGRRGLFSFFTSELESPLPQPRRAGVAAPAGVRGNIARGAVDIENRHVSFEGRAASVELSAELAETLPPEARALYEHLAPRGLVSLKVSFDSGPGSAQGDTAGFAVEVDLNRVSFRHRHGGRTFQFRELTGRCVVSQRTLELLNVHGLLSAAPAGDESPAAIAGAPTSGEVSLAVSISGRLTDISQAAFGQQLSVRVEDVDLARVRKLAEDLSPTMSKLYEYFGPTGRADLKLDLARRPAAEAPMEVSGTVRLKDCRMVAHWFPYPVEDLSGTLGLTPGRVDIMQLRGRQGDADISATGYALNPGPEAEVNIAIVAKQVALSPLLRAAMEQGFPSYLPLYDSLHPEGQVDARVRLHRPPGPSTPFDVATDVLLRGTKILYDGFPYRLTDGAGTIAIAAGRAEIDVTGRHESARLAIHGAIDHAHEGAAVDLRITGSDVPLDAELAAALPADQRETYNRYHPSGKADMEVAVKRSAETQWQLNHQATIDLQGAGMVFEDFPYPIEGIHGRMEISPGRFVIQRLSGANADATITAEGTVLQSESSYTVDLTLRGRRVLLDRDLREAMALVAPKLWATLRPEGLVSFTCRLKKEGRADSPLQARIDLEALDVSLVYKHFPYPLRQAHGRLTYDGSRVVIHDLESRNDNSRLKLSGTIDVRPDGSSRGQLALVTSPLEIDQAFIEALPPAFADALRTLALRGQLYANLDRLSYEIDSQGRATAAWHGTAVIDNAALELGVPVDRVVAYAELTGALADGRISLDGTIDMPQGRLAGKEFTDLHAELHQASGAQRVAITRLEGACYGGRFELESDGQLVLGPAGGYALVLKVKELDFARFVREGLALEAPIEGGRMSGRFALRASAAHPEAAEARGDFTVTAARLYHLPPVVQLLSALSLQGQRDSFSDAEVSFFVRKNTWYFENILLRGGSLTLRGTGRLESDGRLNFVFATGTGPAAGPLAALSELAEGLRRELALVEVTGTLRHPEVSQKSFQGLTAPLRELLKAVEESRAAREAEKEKLPAKKEPRK